MEDAQVFSVIILIGVVLFLLYTVLSIIRVVPDYERLVVLQLGRYRGTRGPGIVIIVPLLEKAFKVDLRERFLDIPAQTAITKDNAPIRIDFLVYYRITEPHLSVLKVDHVVRASTNIATTTLRAIIGEMSLDDVLAKREDINNVLRERLDVATERWGVKITSVEIREIEPPRDVLEAMNAQLRAERERRATVTRADGEREAAIAVAEGEKQAAILRAQGEREAAILSAQGERESQELRAQGYAKALQAIFEEAQKLDQNTMILQYLQALREVGQSPSTKFVLPMELTSMMANFSNMINNKSDDHKA